MPPDSLPDPFNTLGLPATFDLDPADIRRAWLRLASTSHPDRLETGASPGAGASQPGADANEARRTLEDPEKRAEALLIRLGGPRKEHEKTLPPGLLAEMLEVREEMEASLQKGENRAHFETWAEDRRQGHIERVRALFERATRENDEKRAETLREIRIELNAWRYAERMIEQLDPDDDPNRADLEP